MPDNEKFSNTTWLEVNKIDHENDCVEYEKHSVHRSDISIISFILLELV
jgi:hypothetical protein